MFWSWSYQPGKYLLLMWMNQGWMWKERPWLSPCSMCSLMTTELSLTWTAWDSLFTQTMLVSHPLYDPAPPHLHDLGPVSSQSREEYVFSVEIPEVNCNSHALAACVFIHESSAFFYFSCIFLKFPFNKVPFILLLVLISFDHVQGLWGCFCLLVQTPYRIVAFHFDVCARHDD